MWRLKLLTCGKCVGCVEATLMYCSAPGPWAVDAFMWISCAWCCDGDWFWACANNWFWACDAWCACIMGIFISGWRWICDGKSGGNILSNIDLNKIYGKKLLFILRLLKIKCRKRSVFYHSSVMILVLLVANILVYVFAFGCHLFSCFAVDSHCEVCSKVHTHCTQVHRDYCVAIVLWCLFCNWHIWHPTFYWLVPKKHKHRMHMTNKTEQKRQ